MLIPLNQVPSFSSEKHKGAIVGEEYFALDHTDYGATIDKIMSTGAEVVFNTIVPPGLAPFVEQLHKSGFTKRGGHLVCT
jgi:ABC-type branched-subunit amino acid transport system substrate-binding protein